MRNKFTFTLLLSIVVFYTFTYNTNNVASPKAWNSCGNTGCHTSTSNTTVDSIVLINKTTGAAMTGFYPDTVYTIRMVASNTTGTGTFSMFGFQLRAINPSNSSNLGTFQSPPTNTGLTSGILTQSAKLSPTAGKYIVEADWKAPTGASTFALQSVVNAVNNSGTSAGDAFSNSIKSETFNVLGVIGSLGCANKRQIGNLTAGSPASGVSFKVPYTGGNGGSYSSTSDTSTGVLGLTATLAAGSFASGSDSLTYTVSGTPASSGTATFALNIGLKSCNVTLNITAPAGTITSLNCANGRNIGTLINGQAASGVSFKVPYTGGNAGTHSGQTVSSTTVTGLTATLTAGSFVNGDDSVTYTVTGTPSAVGNADFALNIGGRMCTYSFPVVAVGGTITTLDCGNGVFYDSLMNGVAATTADSFKIPYTGGNGGAHTGQIVSSVGVTGLTATLAAGSFATGADSVLYVISGTPSGTGNATFALNIGGKTCNFTVNVAPPVGVVTTLNCAGGTTSGNIAVNIPASSVSFSIPYTGGNGGTYDIDTISSTGVTGLKASIQAGLFANGAGSVVYTVFGTATTTGTASFNLNIGGQTCTYTITVSNGLIGAIDCNSGTMTGSLISGAAATGVSFSIPYSGGNGGTHGGQTVQSTNVMGLTAVLAAGSFATGAGNLVYNVTGTPPSTGTANFAINIGGKTCTFVANIGPGAIGALNCGTGTPTGSLTAGTAAVGVSFAIPYTGGNGGTHAGQIINSTGVAGLTATLGSGSFASGNGTLTYFITGTPSTFGTADFFANIGGKSCLFSMTVSPAAAVVSTLECQNGTTMSSLTAGTAASGVSFSIPYTGGNNGAHSGQIVNSTGVTGLTATLSSGILNNGNGNLSYTVTGTPMVAGVASFDLNIAGKMCTYTLNVKLQEGVIASFDCAGAVSTGTLKAEKFASGVSFKVPYTGGNAGLYTGVNVSSTGVTGLTATTPADTFVAGSDSIPFNIIGTPSAGGVASFELTIAGKTCTYMMNVESPDARVNALNCFSGTSTGALVRTEAASGVTITIPYTGGNKGIYTSQIVNSFGVTGLTAHITGDTLEQGAGNLVFTVSGTPTAIGNASFNFNIAGKACSYDLNVIHPVGIISTMDCDSIKLKHQEPIMAQIPLAGVTIEVPYMGTNGGTYPAMNINSSGVTGLTASANADVLNPTSGTIILTVTGSPASAGTASFMISVGGKMCTYDINVEPLLVGTINSLTCDNGKTAGVLIEGKASNGTAFSIPYDGGNRGYHFGQTVSSTGVTGLTATLNSGQFAIGFGLVSYVITGTPTSSGTANFSLDIGGRQCTYSIPVRSAIGQVTNISCDQGQLSDQILTGTLNPGVFFTIPYQGGNGGPLISQSIQSTDVTGLTAQTSTSVLNFGDGTLRYNLSGTTTTDGLAMFNIAIGNQNCIYNVRVYKSSSSISNGGTEMELYSFQNVVYVKNHTENLSYTVMDLSGKILKEGLLNRSENTINLNSIELSNGIYFVKLIGESINESLKISVE